MNVANIGGEEFILCKTQEKKWWRIHLLLVCKGWFDYIRENLINFCNYDLALNLDLYFSSPWSLFNHSYPQIVKLGTESLQKIYLLKNDKDNSHNQTDFFGSVKEMEFFETDTTTTSESQCNFLFSNIKTNIKNLCIIIGGDMESSPLLEYIISNEIEFPSLESFYFGCFNDKIDYRKLEGLKMPMLKEFGFITGHVGQGTFIGFNQLVESKWKNTLERLSLTVNSLAYVDSYPIETSLKIWKGMPKLKRLVISQIVKQGDGFECYYFNNVDQAKVFNELGLSDLKLPEPSIQYLETLAFSPKLEKLSIVDPQPSPSRIKITPSLRSLSLYDQSFLPANIQDSNLFLKKVKLESCSMEVIEQFLRLANQLKVSDIAISFDKFQDNEQQQQDKTSICLRLVNLLLDKQVFKEITFRILCSTTRHTFESL
ncbi:hypothetical protein DFA_06123 [Cavenderia fasciculata]|uniref:Uncharacterized protein n=1 Tax=Cavenderia fasciculata TaxID=261658 RepID=F4PK61_CACFS|nr:uncharacterized protein DFA_06123 [Cavenderia fasciculata]EGG23985.1 hypothetical protein DFA_06123 [Cavenderia fasciculata]|eukprot:XP_004361836.1 hypothetical protein DFA_06123 [Cavenderia fasciculata]